MIKEFNVIFKYEGIEKARKYFVRNMDSLYKNINHDKELFTDHACICIIYDKELNYISEF